MHEYGGGRVTRSLLSYSCRLSAKVIISTLPEKCKERLERELYEQYMTTCLRLGVENVAKYVQGNYINVEYTDLINPKPKDTRTGDEIVEDVLNRICGGE